MPDQSLWRTFMKICTKCQTKFEDPNARFCGRDGQTLVDVPDAATQPQTPTATANTSLSGSLAMALFTNYFIEPVAPDSGLTPPCQPDVRISTVQLYYELPMISLWYLREHNFIRFVQTASPPRHSSLGIEGTHGNHSSVPGLEFDYWEIIKVCAPGTPVQAVVRQMFGEGSFYPEKTLNLRIKEWLIQLGYGQADTKKKPFFQFGDDGDRRIFEFIPDCQRIMAQQSTARTIHHRWMKFIAEEPVIYQYLFQDVVRAGDDACSSRKHRWSIYCSRAREDLEARSRRSPAGPIQTPGEYR
jgi:hypothetical protein